jgi:hypothetical protein
MQYYIFIKQLFTFSITIGIIPILIKASIKISKIDYVSPKMTQEYKIETRLKGIIWLLAIIFSLLIIFWLILMKNKIFLICIYLSWWLQIVNDNLYHSRALRKVLKNYRDGVLSYSEWQSLVSMIGFVGFISLYKIPESLITYIQTISNNNIADFLLLIILFCISVIYLFLSFILMFELVRFLLNILKYAVKYLCLEKLMIIFNYIDHLYYSSKVEEFLSVNIINKRQSNSSRIFFLVTLLVLLDVIVLLGYFVYRFIINMLFLLVLIIYRVVILVRKITLVTLGLSHRKVLIIVFRLAFIFSIIFLVLFNRIYSIVKMNESSTEVLEFISSSILIPILLSWILELKSKQINNKRDNSAMLYHRKILSKRKYK